MEQQRILNFLNILTHFWERCSYGIVVNGELHSIPSTEYFDEFYRSLTPQQFVKYHGGICYDYVTFGDYFLGQHNIEFEKFYMYTNTPENDTHTFIIVPLLDGYAYIEGAFKYLVDKGINIKIFPTKTDIFQFIAENMFVGNDNDTLSEFRYWVWRYDKNPPYGCNARTFTTYVTQGEPIYEGTVVNDFTIVKLRGATSKDVPNIYKWTMETIDKEWWTPETFRLIKRDAWESIHKTDMVVVNGKTVGMVTAYNYTYNNEPNFWYIAEIYLIPEYRGQGIGKALLEREIQNHNKLLLQVNKDNTHAFELYKSLGFKIVYESDTTYEMVLRNKKKE